MSNSSLSALRLSKSVPDFFREKRGVLQGCSECVSGPGSIQNKNWKLWLSLHISTQNPTINETSRGVVSECRTCLLYTYQGCIYIIYIHPSDLQPTPTRCWFKTSHFHLPQVVRSHNLLANAGFFGGVSKACSRKNFQIYHSQFAAKSSPSALSWFWVSSGALLISSNVSSPEPSWKLQYPSLGGCLERCC